MNMEKLTVWIKSLTRKWQQPQSERTFNQFDDFEEIEWDHRPIY